MNDNNVVNFPSPKFRDNSRGPIRYDMLRPGSTFRVVSEPSRGVYKVTDGRVYRRSLDGYYSTLATDPEVGAIFMPKDLVMPVIRVSDSHPSRSPYHGRIRREA